MKHKSLRQSAALVLVLLLALSCFPILGQAQTELKTLKYVTVDWGTSSPDQQKVIDAVNKKLLADGMDFQLEMTGLPFDSWEQKTNLMLATNEPFDLMLVMNDVIPFSSYLARGAAAPITKYLDEYGPNLKKMINESSWAAVTKDGEVYGIPGNGVPIVCVNEWMTFRKDWMDKYFGKTPETTQELIDSAQAIQDANPDALAWPKVAVPNSYLHRDYDTYPFTVVDELFHVDQQGNVKAWVDTDEFRKDCELQNALMEKALISPDILTLDPSLFRDYVTGAAPGGFSWTGDISIWDNAEFLKNVPEGELSVGLLRPEKPHLDEIGTLHVQMVPSTSQHPELAVRFLDWLYSAQENHDLLVWGIEGEHWEKSDKVLTYNGIERPVIKVLTGEDGTCPYVSGGMWMLGNMNFKSYTDTDSPYSIAIDTLSGDVVPSVTIGFVFDSSSVSAEYLNLLAEVKASIYPLRTGVVPYSEGFESMRAKLSAAGLDKVVAEYQRQLTEFLAKK